MENYFIPFTSEFACDNITRRELRGFDEITTRVQTTKFSHDLLLPLGKRISTSGRLARGVLKPMVDRIETTLRNERGIIDVEVDSYAASRLSSNESYRVAFVGGSGEGEHWLEFLLTEARINRKELTVRTTKADFRIHRHAISRFMQREKLHASQMYPQLMEAVRSSTLIAEAAMLVPGQQIALAIGEGGLLLGRVRHFRWSDCPTHIECLTINGKSADHKLETRPDEGESDYRLIVEMMTYVDQNSLVPSREALRDLLREFQTKRAFEMKMLFDATYFFEASVPAEMADDCHERLAAAVKESRALVNTPEWQQFAATAPGGIAA